MLGQANIFSTSTLALSRNENTMLSFVMIGFFFNDTATTEIYTLSLQRRSSDLHLGDPVSAVVTKANDPSRGQLARLSGLRSAEHTPELQSRSDLVCRLLLEK